MQPRAGVREAPCRCRKAARALAQGAADGDGQREFGEGFQERPLASAHRRARGGEEVVEVAEFGDAGVAALWFAAEESEVVDAFLHAGGDGGVVFVEDGEVGLRAGCAQCTRHGIRRPWRP